MNNLRFLYERYISYIYIKKVIGYKKKLKNEYRLWFHNLDTNDWSFKSYQEIYKINNICDFWKVYNNHYSLKSGMFFLMKSNIKPLYEAKENKNGGNWSMKIYDNNYNNIFKCWLDLSMDLIGNILDEKNIVNGISISYKNKFYIIKIWINDSNLSDLNNINIDEKFKKYNILFNKYK